MKPIVGAVTSASPVIGSNATVNRGPLPAGPSRETYSTRPFCPSWASFRSQPWPGAPASDAARSAVTS